MEPRVSTGDWEFSADVIPRFECLRYISWRPIEEKWGIPQPCYMTGVAINIKHLGSNIKFKFTPDDAVCHWLGEKLDFRNFGKRSNLPTYKSPLQPTVFDSAFTGRVVIEELNKEARDINPEWEVVQWPNLVGQVDWAEKNKLLSGPPMQSSFQTKLTKTHKNLLKKKKSRSECVKPCSEAVAPLVNFKDCMLQTEKFFDGTCYGSVLFFERLVVTHSGWFFSLCQVLSNEKTVVERVRTMTMLCSFKDDIIYREIIEKQSKHFNEELFRSQARRNETDEKDCELRVHYHEVKKLNIRVLGEIQAIRSRMVRDFSVSPAEIDGVFMEELKLPDDKIALFLAFWASEIEYIEARTNTRIQIVPFFNFPHNPIFSKEPPRTAQVYGLRRNVEAAKDMLVTLCSVCWQDEPVDGTIMYMQFVGKMKEWISGLYDD